ncbi:MAG: radical SAM protein [Chloroflexota bacterium]
MDWHHPSELDQAHFDPAEVFAAGLVLHHIANTAYPIGHITTMRSYKVPRSQVQAVAAQAWEEVPRLGLYVHVPFCEARCGFCEYTVLDPPANAENEAAYFDLLLREFDLCSQALDTPAKTLVGFDIGGGTPAFPATRQIERVVLAARQYFNLPEQVAISIETTPRIAARQAEKLRAYYAMGIRRISMGVQTINPRLLEAVGRNATSLAYNQAATENIRSAGFERFNIDVMYGFAHQPLASVEATLRHVIGLGPEYVTLYRMRYKGTRLAGHAEQVSLGEVNAQVQLAKRMLLAAGYHGAPGKNTFSLLADEPGTSDYLTERVVQGTPYLGLGLGAQSLSHKTLAYNSGAADKRLGHYQRQVEAGLLPIQDLYHLSTAAAMGKMISVSFYFGEINLGYFQDKFGVSLEQAFPDEVDFVLRNGLMEYGVPGEGQAAKTLQLTLLGEDQINGVMALFYAGAVKAHLLNMAAGLRLPLRLEAGALQAV